MKQENKVMNELTRQLNDLPQLKMPENRFKNVQKSIENHRFSRKHRVISWTSMLTVFMLILALFIQKNNSDQKDLLIKTLVKRTTQLEQLLIAEVPNYSMPGSKITERIVNMEQYIAKLDEDIRKISNKQRKSELMATKLDLLGHLLLLQRKINQKPDYLRVKPYII